MTMASSPSQVRTTTLFSSSTNPEDRRLAGVEDDWRGEQATRHAMIGYGEAAARDVGAGQLAFAGAAGEVVQLRADLLKPSGRRRP